MIRLFVSYSHQNSEALEQIQSFLKPLEREGLIKIFIDEGIKPGEDWKRKIIEAIDTAAAAVLFISQEFLASDFIWQEELPRILAREAAGELIALPVFLDTSDVKNFNELIRLQGIGTPDKPLLDREPQERKQLYLELTERIRELADMNQPAAPLTESPPRSPAPYPAGSRTCSLTVHLARRGSLIDVQYYLPRTDDAIGSATHHWEDALAAQSLSAPGETLFRVLFGAETEWRQVARALFQQTSTLLNPIGASVRLRVATDDPVLLRLPWCLTAWNDYPLVNHGWEFTTTHVVEPTTDCTTYAPCEVLIIAPQAALNGVELNPEHPKAIVEVLQKVWPTGRQPDYARIVGARSALEKALRGMHPHLIYFYGCWAGSADRPSLWLEDGALRLTELIDRCRELPSPPAVIYLNAPGPAETGPSPGRLLGDLAPLVIWRRVKEWGPDAASQAIAWLNRWLKQGEDPLTALHAVKKQQDSNQAATLAAHSAYRTWTTHTYSPDPRQQYAHLALDRDEQKAQVGKHLKELIRSDRQRVMALVAYAEPGNLLGSLPDQLRHYLELELIDLAEVNWARLQFPDNRQQLQKDLEYELSLQLQADDNEPVKHLLRRHAPRVIGTGKKAVLWLNWGILGTFGKHNTLVAELEAWLRFSSDFLCRHCPDDLRIVSYAAIRAEGPELAEIDRILEDYSWQPWCTQPSFWLNVLPPLGRVSKQHLRYYLVNGYTSCDPHIYRDIAQLLFERTGGDFEQIIKLIQEAENGSWVDLLDRLRRGQGGHFA